MPERIAFLIANQSFLPDSGLQPLRGPHNDVAALSRILRDPERGKFVVREFLDRPHYEILPEIEETLGSAKPGDLVLIYYSGHGKLDRNGLVCLATANTRENSLQATSIPALDINRLVDQSDCNQVVLLLDCCYSGAIENLRGDVVSKMHIIEDAGGFYILTASTARQAAREEETVPGGALMGRFTAAIVHGIENGDADVGRKGEVTLSDLRQYLGKVVTGQTPQFFARRAVGDPLISKSPGTAMSLLDPKIVGDLTAESWHHRMGAVSYLITTMETGLPAARQAARAMLERRLPDERDVDVRKQIEEALAPQSPPIMPDSPPAPKPTINWWIVGPPLGVIAAVTVVGIWLRLPLESHPSPDPVAAGGHGGLVTGRASLISPSPPASEVEGRWTGISNGYPLMMTLTSADKTGQCIPVTGEMFFMASDKTSVSGEFCPAERHIVFDRISSGVQCQKYDGYVSRTGGDLSMQGGFTVTGDCGGPKRKDPYPFSFLKQ